MDIDMPSNKQINRSTMFHVINHFMFLSTHKIRNYVNLRYYLARSQNLSMFGWGLIYPGLLQVSFSAMKIDQCDRDVNWFLKALISGRTLLLIKKKKLFLCMIMLQRVLKRSGTREWLQDLSEYIRFTIVRSTCIQTVAKGLLNVIVAQVLTNYSVILQLNIVEIRKTTLLH